MEKKFTVFIPEQEWPDSHKVLEQIAKVKVGSSQIRYTEDQLKREIKDVDALIITSQQRVTSKVIKAANRLKVIAKYGSKPKGDNVAIQAATENGIVVCYTPGGNSDSVAEHTIALMLCLLKNLCITSSQLRQGKWRNLSLLGQEVFGKTVGIIGFGTIGRKVAEKIQGFDVKLLVYDPYISEKAVEKDNVNLVNLQSLLKQSDIVTIHAALTDETKGLIGEDELKLLGKDAFIVNTARGAILNEKALIKAIEENWIAGAALDTFAEEPPKSNNPLLKMENVVVTPHFASCTLEAYQNEAYTAAEDVLKILNGEKPDPKHIANPEVLSKTAVK